MAWSNQMPWIHTWKHDQAIESLLPSTLTFTEKNRGSYFEETQYYSEQDQERVFRLS